MSGRTPVHLRGGGLYVSGLPEPPKERPSPGPPRPVPYTGGDVLKSGELGKMFDIPTSTTSTPASTPTRTGSRSSVPSPAPSRPLSPAPSRSRSPAPSPSPSVHLSQIPPTGLITSTSVTPSKNSSPAHATAVTPLPPRPSYSFQIPIILICACIVMFGLGLGAGAFVLVTVHQAIIIIVVGAVAVMFGTLTYWNRFRGRGEVERVLKAYPDTDIDGLNLPIGKLVKITGLVTCGGIPLESSYRVIQRCAYTSVELYEYWGWKRWGLRHSKRFVADFYISDKNSRRRFLVRAGNENKVVSFVKSSKLLDTVDSKELSPTFQRWLCDNKLSNGDRRMRLEEGLIQEGSTVSVMGILRKIDNILIIDPPMVPFSTGWQWTRCQLPMYVDGLIILGNQARADNTVYHV